MNGKKIHSIAWLPRVEWLGLIALFLVVGAVGHDPWWKRGEAYSFGIIYDFYLKHAWLVPTEAGNPFMEKPPLYYWTGAILCRLFGAFLPLYDAARLASVLYMAIAAIFTWKASDALFRVHPDTRAMPAISVALLLGTYGLVRHGHAMVTDTALTAGAAISLYALAMLCTVPERWKRGGFWLGLGIGIAFMSKGLILPGVLGISALILYAALPQLRTRTTLWACGVAFLVAAPFLFLWPALLYHESPALFTEWFWNNNIGRFFGFSVDRLGAANRPGFFLWMAPVFAFPVFPLACMEAFCARKHWRTPQYLLPLAVSAIGMCVLLISASGRSPYLMPLMPAFALLATPALGRIYPRLLAGWNRLAQIFFSATILLTWLIWWTLSYPVSDRPLKWLPALFDKWLPTDWLYHGNQTLACCAALLAALLWMASLRFDRRTAAGTARIWFTGAAALWCTISTLLLPWINETRSFRTVITQLSAFIQHSPYKHDCIGTLDLGENMNPMLQYFTNNALSIQGQDWGGTGCPVILTFVNKASSIDVDPRWHLVWEGSRLRDIREMTLRLYARTK